MSNANPLKSIGFVKGLVFFLAAGVVFLAIGVGLTITVIGAIVGVPAMVMGAAMIVMSPFAFAVMHVGQCPHCGTTAYLWKWKRVHKCKGCKRRIRVSSPDPETGLPCLCPLME